MALFTSRQEMLSSATIDPLREEARAIEMDAVLRATRLLGSPDPDLDKAHPIIESSRARYPEPGGRPNDFIQAWVRKYQALNHIFLMLASGRTQNDIFVPAAEVLLIDWSIKDPSDLHYWGIGPRDALDNNSRLLLASTFADTVSAIEAASLVQTAQVVTVNSPKIAALL